VSHSWPTANEKNDKLYLKEIPGSGGASYNRVVVIRSGVYNKGTGRASIETACTAYAVIYSRADMQAQNTIPILWTFADGSYVGSTNKWEQIWAAGNVVEVLPPQGLADCCELIGLRHARLQLAPGFAGTCSHIDLQRHKALYLCSDTLPSNSLDLRGRSDIIKQIVVGNSSPGQVLVDALPTMANFSHLISFSVLKHINFTICGHDGRIADLYDHHVSFVIELLRPSDMLGLVFYESI